MKNNGHKKHNWTDSEFDFVRVNYDGTEYSKKWIAGELSRKTGEKITSDSIKYVVTTMDLGRKRLRDFKDGRGGNYMKWTPKNLERLSSMLARSTVVEVAKTFGMRESGLRAVCTRHHISLKVRSGWYTLGDAAYILGMHENSIRKLAKDGLLKAKRHYDHGRNAHYGGGGLCWEISEDDLRQFIRTYPHELMGRNVDMYTIVDILAGIRPPLFKGNDRGG